MVMPPNILDKAFLAWISKNKFTFILATLISGNVYQYIDKANCELRCNEDKKELNIEIQNMEKDAVEYERRRSEKLEFLFQNLSEIEKHTNTNNPNGTHNDK